MLRRNVLLGLMGFVAVAGLATATPAPPIDPNIEGREPNPVIREFYEAEKSTTERAIGPMPPARTTFDSDSYLADFWEMLMYQLSFQLETHMGKR